MTSVAIMQPTYLPWIGYFDLMDQVDRFVLLDSVQFSRRSWQQRNRIRTATGLQWLTVPIRSEGDRPIRDVEIAKDASFPHDHVRAVELAYRRAPHYMEHAPAFADALRAGHAEGRLVSVTIPLIAWLARHLGITTPLVRSSTLPVEGKRSDLLAAICEAVGGDAYVSPVGSTEYLREEADAFARRGVDVRIHQYEHPSYAQVHEPFLPFASALDLLLNAGPDAGDVMRSGRRPPKPLMEVI